MRLYFVTVNEFKTSEVKHYLKDTTLDLEVVEYPIREILNKDLVEIVKDKTLKAYQYLGRPCAVEHGGLLIDSLNKLPGGLSKVIWDEIGEKLCSLIPSSDDRLATAKSVIGYCDGKMIHTFIGETRGKVSNEGRGTYSFQWDPIFIPDGANQTYAEMGFPEKAKYSQAAKAWKMLADHLKTDK